MNAGESLEDLECTSEQLQRREMRFLCLLFYVMDKSNFKMVSDAEAEVALAGEYLLSLPIAVDDSKVSPSPGCIARVEGGGWGLTWGRRWGQLDDTLMTRFFDKYPMEHKPTFSDKVGRRRGADIIPVPHLDILTS